MCRFVCHFVPILEVCKNTYRQLRARRVLLQIKDVLLRTRRALLPYTLYSNSPFWFSTEHLWIAITPFWLSTDDIIILCRKVSCLLLSSYSYCIPRENNGCDWKKTEENVIKMHEFHSLHGWKRFDCDSAQILLCTIANYQEFIPENRQNLVSLCDLRLTFLGDQEKKFEDKKIVVRSWRMEC